MAAQSMPQPQGQPQPQSHGQEQQGDPLADFRKFAEMANELGKKYPEAAEPMAKVLKEIQGAMVQVSGNPQRQQPQKAPPQG